MHERIRIWLPDREPVNGSLRRGRTSEDNKRGRRAAVTRPLSVNSRRSARDEYREWNLALVTCAILLRVPKRAMKSPQRYVTASENASRGDSLASSSAPRSPSRSAWGCDYAKRVFTHLTHRACLSCLLKRVNLPRPVRQDAPLTRGTAAAVIIHGRSRSTWSSKYLRSI